MLKLGIFLKLSKVNYPQNSNFWQMDPLFSTWFDLVTHLIAWSMISRDQIQHLDLITWIKTFPKIQVIDSWGIESIDEKSTVTQKSNFDFLVNIRIQKSRIIKTLKTIKLHSNKTLNMKVVGIDEFYKFWSVFHLNFLANFHQVPIWFSQSGQHESCR